MSGLAWLNELMFWLGKLFPRLVLIKSGNVGVWFGRSGRMRTLPAGRYIYWPIATDITIVSTRDRTVEIASQLHGREVLSIAVQYRVLAAATVLRRVNDLFSLLDDRAQAALADAYDAGHANTFIAEHIEQSLRTEFAPFGVEIQRVSVIQRGKVIPVKNLNDWAQHAVASLA